MVRDKQTIRQLIAKHITAKDIIEKEETVSSLTRLFLQKSERDLQIATVIFTTGKKEGNPNLQSAFFNWVIIIGYYSMFHAAKAALARMKIKVSEQNAHEAVLNAMYHYYVYSGKLEVEIFSLFENAKEKALELIEKLERARTERTNVNYEINRQIKEENANDLLKEAKEFVQAMRTLVR